MMTYTSSCQIVAGVMCEKRDVSCSVDFSFGVFSVWLLACKSYNVWFHSQTLSCVQNYSKVRVIEVFFLTFVSAGMGDDDLDDVYWSCEEDMKPESWEEMLERRAGACWGSVELRYRWQGWWWWKRWCEEEEEEEEEGEWEWEPLDPLESLLLTLFRLLWKGTEWGGRRRQGNEDQVHPRRELKRESWAKQEY